MTATNSVTMAESRRHLLFMTAAIYLSTAKLSKATGIGRETLRFYETRGLIKPIKRTSAGYRQYDTSVIDRIGFIKQTQLAGFTLKEIKHLLQLNADKADTCGEMRKLMDDKLKQVEALLTETQQRHAAILNLVSTCSEQNESRRCDFVVKGQGCC